MGREFIVSVNSTCDMPLQWLEEHDVTVVPLSYTIDGQTYTDMKGLTGEEFFAKLREGKMSVTSQVNPQEAADILEPIVRSGKDVLHLSFTSAMSGTHNSMKIAADLLREKYPDANIAVVDTLCACMGEGVLLYYALAQKAAGKTMNDICSWVEEHKKYVCHNVTVDDLQHLYRGGRISKTQVVLGTMLQVKPLIHVDDSGRLQVIGKERGRRRALQKLVERTVKQAQGHENEVVMITHGDCIDDAEYVERLIREKMSVRHIMINMIGTVIGSHTGPGVVAVFCMGAPR